MPEARQVLIAEDSYFLAQDLAQALAKYGVEIIGPAPTVADAISLAKDAHRIDCAVLDIDLNGRKTFGLADLLRRSHVSIVFMTGYPKSVIPCRFAEVPSFEKPIDTDEVASSIFDEYLAGVGSRT
jgi:ActR/RegA family two-component response regulator